MDALLQLAASWGPTGLLAVTVMMILTGRLVPRSHYDSMLAQNAQTIEALRKSNDAERERTDKYLIPSVELQRTVLGALPAPPATRSEGSG